LSQNKKVESRPRLSSTKTSRTGDAIIDELHAKLVRQGKQFKKMILIDNIPVEQIRLDNTKEIHALVADSVIKAYQAGIDYSNKFLDTKHVFSQKDLNAVNKLSFDIESRFWQLMSTIQPDKINEFIFDVIASFFATLASDLVTKAINQGTLFSLEPDPNDINLFGTSYLVEFVTRRDSKVCPICEPLDGLVFEVGDDNKIAITDDTHPNCRCRYLIHAPDGLVIG